MLVLPIRRAEWGDGAATFINLFSATKPFSVPIAPRRSSPNEIRNRHLPRCETSLYTHNAVNGILTGKVLCTKSPIVMYAVRREHTHRQTHTCTGVQTRCATDFQIDNNKKIGINPILTNGYDIIEICCKACAEKKIKVPNKLFKTGTPIFTETSPSSPARKRLEITVRLLMEIKLPKSSTVTLNVISSESPAIYTLRTKHISFRQRTAIISHFPSGPQNVIKLILHVKNST